MSHPLAKFALLCAYAAAVLAAPGLAAKGALVAPVLVLGGRRLAAARTFRLALVFGGFIFLVQALLAPGDEVARLGPLSVTLQGIKIGAQMALRFFGVLAGSLLFVATTPPEDFAAALSHTRLPYRYTYTLVLALRFLPLFAAEYQRVREAQAVRGLRLRPWNLLTHVRWTAVPVLASALMRADCLAMAMQGRAFGRHPSRTVLDVRPWRRRDRAALAVAVGGLAAAGWFLAGGGARWP
ncbi:MAG: energy-coupling factor transporter transmembrane component T family protein [Candidatus Bipolaricaulaceae bacterium]